jgi:lipid II:glycine glycyltransferase (peptidoglycan interpeptide bridge formation enzyme)
MLKLYKGVSPPRRGDSLSNRKWESYLDKFPEANFLQSWVWGEFHKNLGHPVYRISFTGGMLQAIVEPARRGRYLEIPGGPLLSGYASLSLWKQAVSLMKEVAGKENCVFIRMRPQISRLPRPAFGGPRNDIPSYLGFRPAPMHLHAELTRVLDLTKTDEQLLSQMRKSTRYEIKRALKMRIKVEAGDDENLVDNFVRLQSETSAREKFVPFSREYLLEQFRAFRKTNSVRWFLIRSDPAAAGSDLLISMALVIFYRGEAVYHYAASNAAARHIPAAYAIQWAIIQEARRRGCIRYNLWGDVADDQLGKHRFSGPSLFKRGFGGDQVAYLHARDLPLSWKYWLNWGVENLRKKFRSLA